MGTDDAGRVAAAFDRGRLREGRELRGRSQVRLARDAGGLSPASISQFENGHARPSPATLQRIATALDLPLLFFARRPGLPDEIPDAFFRSLRSTTVIDRRRAQALAKLVRDLAIALEEHVALPDVVLPARRPPHDQATIERTAVEARRELGLTSGPVENVVRTLERHGVLTVRLRLEVDEMDAFSVPYRYRPVVVLGSDKGRRDRSRFDAAHELGHLVLKHDPGRAAGRELETQANQFAAAFLMPADDIAAELPSKIDWDQLLDLKLKWHVSLAALLRRSRTLEIMSQETFTQAMKAISARRWRIHEPGELGSPERPTVLATAVQLAEAAGVSLEEIASKRGLPLRDLRGILSPSLDPRPRVVI